jgi:hypothetical protein
MRVSGERHKNNLNAAPENFASARNAGRPARINNTTAQGENEINSAEKLTSEIAFLRETERAHDERERSARCFASSTRELVVKVRVLEVRQTQRERFFENHDVHAVTQLRTQERLAQRNTALSARDCSDQQAFGNDEP